MNDKNSIQIAVYTFASLAKVTDKKICDDIINRLNNMKKNSSN